MLGLRRRTHISDINKILRIPKFEVIYYKYLCVTINLLKRNQITWSFLNDIMYNDAGNHQLSIARAINDYAQ